MKHGAMSLEIYHGYPTYVYTKDALHFKFSWENLRVNIQHGEKRIEIIAAAH